jgi:hypothetical protein
MSVHAGFALGDVAPYVGGELAQPPIGDVFDRGERAEDIRFSEHAVDIRSRVAPLLVDNYRTNVLS